MEWSYETRLEIACDVFGTVLCERSFSTVVCKDDTYFFVTSSYCKGLLVYENKKRNSLSFLKKSEPNLSNCSFKDAGNGGSRTPLIRVLALKLLMLSVNTFCKFPSCIARNGYQFLYNCPFLQRTE